MSYLYLARYHRKTGKFVLKNSLSPENQFARALYTMLVGFRGPANATAPPKPIEFYIAYHPDIEFYKKHKRKAFCQYVFLRSKEDPALNLSFEGEYFLDSGFEMRDIVRQCKEAEPGTDRDEREVSFCSLKPYPILHITSLDLFNPKIHNKDPYYKIPRYIRVLDSSIWNLYVPVWKAKFPLRLESAIHKIIDYQDLYELNVIRENADFRARMAYNSFLSGGDHADNVAPFLFHSETEMKKKRTRKINDVRKYASQLEWRVLIIDDHANKPMAGPTHLEVKKIEVIEGHLLEIERAIHQYTAQALVSGLKQFTLEYAHSLKEAKEKLREKRYDIIFIDYLLGKDDERKREYAYQLLKEMNLKSNRWADSKGIYGRFWFFNISSFSHTLEERFREQGLAYYSNHWNFARGASPLITPELFLYELSRFLIRQTEVMTELPMPDSKQEAQSMDIKETRIITLTDLLKKIYRSDVNVSLRRRAAYFFDSVLTQKSNYKILQRDLGKDRDHGSLLVPSLFPDLEHYDNAFWEHVMHLVYVTAYGSVRQWPELWDELLFIKPRLAKTDKGKEVFQLIEERIIELKERGR